MLALRNPPTQLGISLCFDFEERRPDFALKQLNQESVFDWISEKIDLFLFKNHGKFHISSIFHLKNEVKIGLLTYLELYHASAIIQLSQESACV